ncbi:hypothetical protein [Candidatus Nitrosocosmicus sp. T]
MDKELKKQDIFLLTNPESSNYRTVSGMVSNNYLQDFQKKYLNIVELSLQNMVMEYLELLL